MASLIRWISLLPIGSDCPGLNDIIAVKILARNKRKAKNSIVVDTEGARLVEG